MHLAHEESVRVGPFRRANGRGRKRDVRDLRREVLHFVGYCAWSPLCKKNLVCFKYFRGINKVEFGNSQCAHTINWREINLLLKSYTLLRFKHFPRRSSNAFDNMMQRDAVKNPSKFPQSWRSYMCSRFEVQYISSANKCSVANFSAAQIRLLQIESFSDSHSHRARPVNAGIFLGQFDPMSKYWWRICNKIKKKIENLQ